VRPQRRIQGGELAILWRDGVRHQVGGHEIGVFGGGGAQIGEDHALIDQRGIDVVCFRVDIDEAQPLPVN